MLDRDRHAYITFGWVTTIVMLLLGGALYHSNYTGIQRSAEYGYRCAEQYKKLAASSADIASSAREQEAGNSDTQYEGDPDWCDLAAQQSMAESTRGMHWAAWATVIFSGVGAFLIWRTLIATQDTVAETRRIGEAQVRAYISPPRVSARIETENGIRWFRIEGYLSNSGNSPALLPTVICHVSMGEDVVTFRQAPMERDIVAGETDFLFIDQGSPFADGISEYLYRGGELIFQGVVQYNTVFGGDPKTTNFRLALYRTQEGDGPLNVRMSSRLRDGTSITHYRD